MNTAPGWRLRALARVWTVSASQPAPDTMASDTTWSWAGSRTHTAAAGITMHGSAEWPVFQVTARRGNSATDYTYGHVGTRKCEIQNYLMKDF